jgi:phage FluMu protein Com
MKTTRTSGNHYRCTHCQRIVTRDSTKAWVESYCTRTGKIVHLIRERRRRFVAKAQAS